MNYIRFFNEEAFELQPRLETKRARDFDNDIDYLHYRLSLDPPVGYLRRAYMYKSEAKLEAQRRREIGEKVRIVANKSVKHFGGDIGYFLYSNKCAAWRYE